MRSMKKINMCDGIITIIFTALSCILTVLVYNNMKGDKFVNQPPSTTNPGPSYTFPFLHSQITNQNKILKPSEETLFPTNFDRNGLCQYPEQCVNPTTHKWGSLATQTTTSS